MGVPHELNKKRNNYFVNLGNHSLYVVLQSFIYDNKDKNKN